MVEEKNYITPLKLTESVSCLVRTIFAKRLESSLQLRQTLIPTANLKITNSPDIYFGLYEVSRVSASEAPQARGATFKHPQRNCDPQVEPRILMHHPSGYFYCFQVIKHSCRNYLFLAVEENFNFKLKGCVLSWVYLQVWYYMIHIQVQMLHLTAFKLYYTLNLTSSPDCVRIQIGLFIASLECYHTESWSYLWWNKRNRSPAVMQKQ